MPTKEFADGGVALVAGGSGGLGRAVCERLAQAGVHVALTYRSRADAAEETAAACRAAGGRATIVAADLERADQVQQLVDGLVAEHGPLQTVVHAVGSDIPMRYVSQVDVETWHKVLHADVDGFFHLVRASLPHLRKARGSIVALTSAGLKRYPVRDVLSVAPKAAIEALVRGIAREEGRYGVRANCVAIGVIDAGMFQRLSRTELAPDWIEAARDNAALGRFGTAAEVAEATIFLASQRSSYVTGQTLYVDGGYSV
jgi:NAD(P)-dependent dehydrogenase (short-subunit alcohol dehydrogenase family)